MAGFSVPDDTKALIAEVDAVGREEPLSMETLAPVLSFYVADGWQAGCETCIEILRFGGIGHTLAVHAGSEHVIERFALEKPSMRIVVNTVAALGSVGLTTALFPSMTLGPGTVGGSITSDNISPMHLLNVKRLAFETAPLNTDAGEPIAASQPAVRSASHSAPSARRPAPSGKASGKSWMDEIEARLRDRAGNSPAPSAGGDGSPAKSPAPPEKPSEKSAASVLPMPDAQIDKLVRQFKK
jgi:acetaldehyde dehydrogenase (acetylating)